MKKARGSASIREFVDILYQFEKEHPDELFLPGIGPDLVIDCLKDTFLGADWYTVMPVGVTQVNTIILCEILTKHSKEFNKLVKEKRKEQKKELERHE